MTVRLYLSTDASAPVLTGQVGSLTTLLDAVLVNGYGSKTAAGWSIAYTATNKRDYKQGTGSNGFYLDIDDTGPGGGGAKEARLRGYEVMTAQATGTNLFPTTAQSSTFGVICRKSTTADATARPWYCVADATCFYLFVDTGDMTGPNYAMAVAFGDFFSYKAGDVYNTIIIGRTGENQGGNQYESLPKLSSVQNMLIAFEAGHYIARSWTATVGALPCIKTTSGIAYGGLNVSYNGIVMGSHGTYYPNGPDSALELAPVWLMHNSSVRGYLKGLWNPCHVQPLGHGDQFSGTGNMAGKSFMALNMQSTLNDSTANGPANSIYGQVVIETSDTWS